MWELHFPVSKPQPFPSFTSPTQVQVHNIVTPDINALALRTGEPFVPALSNKLRVIDVKDSMSLEQLQEGRRNVQPAPIVHSIATTTQRHVSDGKITETTTKIDENKFKRTWMDPEDLLSLKAYLRSTQVNNNNNNISQESQQELQKSTTKLIFCENNTNWISYDDISYLPSQNVAERAAVCDPDTQVESRQPHLSVNKALVGPYSLISRDSSVPHQHLHQKEASEVHSTSSFGTSELHHNNQVHLTKVPVPPVLKVLEGTLPQKKTAQESSAPTQVLT